MKKRTIGNSTEYLCPRIVSVENNLVYYGGDQSWFSRNTAYRGGCGPVCAANILTVFADQHPQYQEPLGITIDDKHMISQDLYLDLLQKLYDSMHIIEVPLLSKIYDKLSRHNKIFKKVPATIGTNIIGLTYSILRFSDKQGIPLQFKSRNCLFCGYTRGLTFIKLAISNGYPIVLLTTNNHFPFTTYERPYLSEGKAHKMAHHFVTITALKEYTDGRGPELIITTWGKTGTIFYSDLYKSWQSPLAFGSSMVYFIPAKSKKVTKRNILKSFTILIKR